MYLREQKYEQTVMIHGGTHMPNETSRALGIIAPNSGTGGLRKIGGTVEFINDKNGKKIILDINLPDE